MAITCGASVAGERAESIQPDLPLLRQGEVNRSILKPFAHPRQRPDHFPPRPPPKDELLLHNPS